MYKHAERQTCNQDEKYKKAAFIEKEPTSRGVIIQHKTMRARKRKQGKREQYCLQETSFGSSNYISTRHKKATHTYALQEAWSTNTSSNIAKQQRSRITISVYFYQGRREPFFVHRTLLHHGPWSPRNDLNVLLACSLTLSSHLLSLLLEEMSIHNLYIHYRAALVPLLSSSSNAGGHVNGPSHFVTRREFQEANLINQISSEGAVRLWRRDDWLRRVFDLINNRIQQSTQRRAHLVVLLHSIISTIIIDHYFGCSMQPFIRAFRENIHTHIPHTTYNSVCPHLFHRFAHRCKTLYERKKIASATPRPTPLFCMHSLEFIFIFAYILWHKQKLFFFSMLQQHLKHSISAISSISDYTLEEYSRLTTISDDKAMQRLSWSNAKLGRKKEKKRQYHVAPSKKNERGWPTSNSNKILEGKKRRRNNNHLQNVQHLRNTNTQRGSRGGVKETMWVVVPLEQQNRLELTADENDERSYFRVYLSIPSLCARVFITLSLCFCLFCGMHWKRSEKGNGGMRVEQRQRREGRREGHSNTRVSGKSKQTSANTRGVTTTKRNHTQKKQGEGRVRGTDCHGDRESRRNRHQHGKEAFLKDGGKWLVGWLLTAPFLPFLSV